MTKVFSNIIHRIFSHVGPVSNLDSCWEWKGNASGGKHGGYGRIKINGKDINVTRVVYEYFKGEIPRRHYIMHTCDNPPCINPRHLIAGTPSDNMYDMHRKLRHPKNKNTNQFTEVKQDEKIL